MAVYTDVAAEELAAFLAGYDIGELLAYKGIAEGVENSNFLVHTSQGNFIPTLYEQRVGAGAARARVAARPAAGRDSCRPVSRQRVLPRRQALRPDRLLLRLHRCARLRCRHLPQCLVLRDRPFLQRDQGPKPAAGLCGGAPAIRRGTPCAAAAGTWRSLALPADAPGRLVRPPARRAGAAEGSDGIFPQ